jgi:hypothetical protein
VNKKVEKSMFVFWNRKMGVFRAVSVNHKRCTACSGEEKQNPNYFVEE